VPEYVVYHVSYEGYDYEKKQRTPRRRAWSFLDKNEAQAHRLHMIEHVQRTMTSGEGRATPYYVEEEHVVTDFAIPSAELPRDFYFQEWEEKPSRPGCWDVADVRILRRYGNGNPSPVVAEYHRDYRGRPPFEPFRQVMHGEERHYALISLHYEQTDVMDLSTGRIIASEDCGADEPDGYGFCPVGFYVPDWRDVHDDSDFPGAWHWDDRHDRWPDGTLGFVWGCYWGDDNGWKVQALDLTGIAEGVITRDARFGYQHLASKPGDAREFIQVSCGEGNRGPTVTFTVPKQFTIGGEKLATFDDWQWTGGLD
jgi:hypothetical protein